MSHYLLHLNDSVLQIRGPFATPDERLASARDLAWSSEYEADWSTLIAFSVLPDGSGDGSVIPDAVLFPDPPAAVWFQGEAWRLRPGDGLYTTEGQAPGDVAVLSREDGEAPDPGRQEQLMIVEYAPDGAPYGEVHLDGRIDEAEVVPLLSGGRIAVMVRPVARFDAKVVSPMTFDSIEDAREWARFYGWLNDTGMKAWNAAREELLDNLTLDLNTQHGAG